MKIDELLRVAEGLGWMSDRLAALPENRDDGLAAGLHCQMARLIVLELARHLSDGVEPYEALRRAAVGELEVPPEKATLLRLLRPNRAPPDEGTPAPQRS